MKSIGHAMRRYKHQHPETTMSEYNAFIFGWTAKEVALVHERRNGVICADIIKRWISDHSQEDVFDVNAFLIFIQEETR